MKKICCVFNYPPLYRYTIYSAMNKEFNCDFFFGDSVFEPIQAFDVKNLAGYKGTIHAIKCFKNYVWHTGIKAVFDKKYTDYVVTGSNNYLINWILLFYCVITRRRIYLWSHGTSKEHFPILERMKQKLFYRLPDGIFLYARFNMPILEILCCNQDKVHIHHNSLNTAEQSKIYSYLKESPVLYDHFQNNYPVIIYIGRIQKRKKVDQIIYALELLKKRGELINLVIVGEAANDNEIEKIVTDLRLLDQVWFYGACYDENINAQLIYNSALCVSPGNVGLTAIHSLTYGTPVVTNDNFVTQMPEFEAVIDGCTGSFFKEDDIEDLANEISKWTKLSSKERLLVRHQCRRTIQEEWSTDYQINIFKSVFYCNEK